MPNRLISWCVRGCMGGGRKSLRGWLALLLAFQIAIPLPVFAQTPPGIQPLPGVQAPEEPGLQAPGHTPSSLLSVPTISIVEPQNGTIVTRENQQIVINFRDPRDELDLTSFRVLINGVDRTKEFQVTSSGATLQGKPGSQTTSSGGTLRGTQDPRPPLRVAHYRGTQDPRLALCH